MKTKEVCDATGLSRKTVMFYEEKGLFAPRKIRQNGRDYREYSEEDVRRLKDIATLRKAWFTIDEIRRMKEAPEKTEEIFRDYYVWLKAQKKELEELLEIAAGIEREQLVDMESLAGQIESAAANLPLPKMDVQPHFKYLDEIEEEPRNVVPQTDFSEGGRHDKASMIAVADRAEQTVVRLDDIIDGLGLKAYAVEMENGTVAERTDRDSTPVRVYKTIILAIAIAAWLVVFQYLIAPGDVEAKVLPVILVAAVSTEIRAVAAWVSWKKDRKHLNETEESEFVQEMAEEKGVAGMKNKKRIPKGYVAMALAMMIVIGVAVGMTYRNYRIDRSFRKNPDVNFRTTRVDESRGKLEELGTDLSMPGTGGMVLTFESPISFTFQDTGYSDQSVLRGDELQCDFVSWSHDFFSDRTFKITVNGREYSAKLSSWKLAILYRSALKQNGLQEEFRSDYGTGLTYFSARSALRMIDKQIFELGLYQPTDYPYNRVLSKSIVVFLMLFSIPFSLVITAGASLAAASIRYRIWLVGYNREHMADWDRIAGTLPQFVSLRADGLDRPIPEFKRPGVKEQFRDLFR